MPQDTKLEQQINEIAALGKENKNVDVAALMTQALQSQERNAVSPRAKRWAYLISIGAPPFGLLFALKYYMSAEDDARQVGHMCVILTLVSVAGVWFFTNMILSGSGASIEQVQQIKPEDVLELTR
jgi:hypothetical protein